MLALEGARNLRDLGGYATLDGRITRWRTLYRSDSSHRFAESARAALVARGLKTIVDLREDDEIAANPSVFCASNEVSYCWRPFWGSPMPNGLVPDLSRGYVRELDLCGDRLATVCRELAQPGGLPALVHCAAGKDRTGVLVALLLAVARVSPEIIVDDYVLTKMSLGEEYLEESRRWVVERGGVWQEQAHLFDTPPERMQRTLEHLERRWGGAERYLISHGMPDAEVEQLRELLTEPAA
jgi:protein-tyrosine phosphatase